MSNTYIIVEGGLIQNDPALPVFDLDLLENNRDEEIAQEALDTFERMARHPDRAGLANAMVRVARVLDNERLEKAREILGDQDPLTINDPQPTTTSATISFQVQEVVEVNVEMTVTDKLLAQAAAAGYPRTAKGVGDMISDGAGGEKELADSISQTTPNAVLDREVRWVSAPEQE